MGSTDSILAPLTEKRNLTDDEASVLMDWLIGGEAQDDEILTALNALCDKGVAPNELVSFARVMRKKALVVDHSIPELVDTCGTGGGRPTFNLSTSAALVAAAAGVKIAKHGNRSTTGLGSADVLEFLGVRLGGTSRSLTKQLESLGIAFLFAPSHHPAMRHVASARKALGRRSVFNLLGPLANPAGARRQLIGVYDPSLLSLVGHAVAKLGTDRAVIVHSDDGLDELSPCGTSQGIVFWEGIWMERSFTPEDFGQSKVAFEDIQPGIDLAESAKFLEEAISKIDSPKSRAVIPSAAVAIWLSGLEDNLIDSAERARSAIRDGAVPRKLAELVRAGDGNLHE